MNDLINMIDKKYVNKLKYKIMILSLIYIQIYNN